jgi:hypothetical protein
MKAASLDSRLTDVEVAIDGGGGGGGAPTNATYVTLSTNAMLTNERVLTAGTGITLTDAGAGSTITVATTAEPAGSIATHNAVTTGAHGMSALGASIVAEVFAFDIRTTLGLGAAAIAATLDAIPDPVASVDFAQQQALRFRIENRTSDPAAPAVGEVWLRTDL